MHALRHLRLPALLVAIISFMYRYLFVLADEALRCACLPGYKSGGTVTWRARVTGNMAGQLFVRSYERSDRVYNAMLARGYSGHFLTLNPHVMHPIDWAAGALAVMILLAIQIVGRLIFFG